MKAENEKQSAAVKQVDLRDLPEELSETTSDTALELRRPSVPVTLNELAFLKEQGKEILEARIEIMETARRAAIRGTSPEDWILNKAKDGSVLGYLQDVGCQRPSIEIFGIRITPTSKPQKIPQPDGSFVYVMSGDGFCTLTGKQVLEMEGGRSSNDDNVRGKKAAELDLAVRKNCRANMDGRIIRKLAGLGNVPVQELVDCWKGTNKTVERCVKAHGFGSQAERSGAKLQDDSGIAESDRPKCGLCNATMIYRAGGTTKQGKVYEGFWSCPSYQEHKKANEPAENYSIRASDWQKTIDARMSEEPAP